MYPYRLHVAPAALCAALLATGAAADLTAEQVWGDWRSYMEGMGYAVTATQDATGNTLSVSDITVEIPAGPEVERMEMRLGALQFVEGAGGVVEVVMPSPLPMVIEVTPLDGSAPSVIELSYTQAGQRMIATGDPTDMTYDYSADSIQLALTGLTSEGAPIARDNATFTFGGNDLRSLTTLNVGETRRYAQTMQLADVSYALKFREPGAVEAISISSTIEGLDLTGTTTLPAAPIAQTQDLLPLIGAGFAFDGTFTATGSETLTDVISDEGETKIKTGAQGATLTVALGQDGVRYQADARQAQMGAQIAGLPFPLFAEMAAYGMTFSAPLLQSDTPQDFALGFNLTDFTMSDIIWALFDPSGALPRDPATVALALSGETRVLVDTLDPDKMAALAEAGALPAEIDALTIDRLTVDAVGAKLEGMGTLTFDNSDRTTLPGFPKPVGDVTFNLAGANALLDKLVSLGLLPSEQVMGARMMLGVFAVPGPAPDTLTSTIEFNEEGQILANGQRIR